jgi:hypothetical protein
MLTKKRRLDVDRKKEKKHFSEHRTYANRRFKSHPQEGSISGGLRKYNRSVQAKKAPFFD